LTGSRSCMHLSAFAFACASASRLHLHLHLHLQLHSHVLPLATRFESWTLLAAESPPLACSGAHSRALELAASIQASKLPSFSNASIAGHGSPSASSATFPRSPPLLLLLLLLLPREESTLPLTSPNPTQPNIYLPFYAHCSVHTSIPQRRLIIHF